MPGRTKKIVLLGATGSIGENTLQVLRNQKDRLELVGVACNKSFRELGKICREFDVHHAAIFDEAACEEAAKHPDFADVNCYPGVEGLNQVACLEEADIVLAAIVGTQSLAPCLKAIECGKHLALANKEILVMAGGFFTEAVKKHGVALLPVDSEHNAIFQCLDGEDPAFIRRLLITASGGMFRDRPLDSFHSITPEEAIKHPNWDMGPKITVDSATMANKGLEVIEAHWLFGVSAEQIDVTIHPQSIVHSMVEFVDGSIIGQMSPPSMTFAIQHALLYPERRTRTQASLDFTQAQSWTFSPPQKERYPCLQLAFDALHAHGCAPAVFNAANEIAVQAFLERRIPFTSIPQIIEKTLEESTFLEPQCLADVLEADRQARLLAQSLF